jgi:hypothetical protein
MEAETITKGATSALKVLGQKHLEALCATLATQSVAERQAASSRMMVKLTPRIWLEDYNLASMAGRANDDLFIIEFLPIYLADSTRAWMDHLPRNITDS